jgi:hypothetical protein
VEGVENGKVKWISSKRDVGHDRVIEILLEASKYCACGQLSVKSDIGDSGDGIA